MVRKLITALLTILVISPAFSQENTVRRLPEIKGENAKPYQVYTEYKTGFFCAAELAGAYSCRLEKSNFGFLELDAIGGYRFNEYLNVGAGMGARYYFANNRIRYSRAKWGGPIFIDVRGQLIPHLYRNYVPYYSFDIGGTIRDGFMLRPTLGLRIGEVRSAFLIGIAYTGQSLTSFSWNDMGQKLKKNRFVSFITLKVGYQF